MERILPENEIREFTVAINVGQNGLWLMVIDVTVDDISLSQDTVKLIGGAWIHKKSEIYLRIVKTETMASYKWCKNV